MCLRSILPGVRPKNSALASDDLRRCAGTVEACDAAAAEMRDGGGPCGGAWRDVRGSLLDDLGTPGALAALSEPMRAANDLLFTKRGKRVRDAPLPYQRTSPTPASTFKSILRTLAQRSATWRPRARAPLVDRRRPWATP